MILSKSIESIVDAMTAGSAGSGGGREPGTTPARGTRREGSERPDARRAEGELSPSEIRSMRSKGPKNKQFVVRTNKENYQRWMERYQDDGDGSFNSWVERALNYYVDNAPE